MRELYIEFNNFFILHKLSETFFNEKKLKKIYKEKSHFLQKKTLKLENS